MPTFFQRPENALKRAKEFIAVEKKQQALDALYDVIKSKKHRTWQKIHEPIMEQYLELCVELKKSHVAKEGLYQYKNICQQINIRSLEEVVRKYLNLAEEKTELARQESHQAVVDVDDLDVIQTPENLLLSAVSGEDTQDRTDRAILTPWVKFLWESYRQCLDLLRNNNSVEKLYQDIAQNAFKFCLKYGRKTEFRKLCDNLRMHLNHVYKHQHQQRAINLNNPESQAMHLETRLAQLDSAIQMELWQEAFKAVEDIHNLIILAKKSPKPSLMANYYQKLGLVFWKSGCHMFHACAWHRLFNLSREQRRNLSQDELQRLASRVLCATLAIPIPPSRNQIDQVLEMDESTADKQRRLALLLGLQNPPSRQQMVKDLQSKFNLIPFVHPELQNLFRWLEVEFHPLKLTERVQSCLDYIKERDELAQYVPALQNITVTRLLKQVSQVYQTIKFERLLQLSPMPDKFELERIIVDAGRTLELQVRIDHRTQSLSFGTNLGVAQKEDVPEGPNIQSMPSESIRNQLTQMAQAIDSAVNIITPHEQKSKREDLRAHIVQCYRQTARKEHMNILMRRQIIEERKEKLENLNVQREREEQEQKYLYERERRDAEQARLQREAEERERQRVLEEEKEISRKQAKERLEQLRQTPLGAKMIAEMDEDVISDLNMDEIVAKQIEQLEKEKKELAEKLRTQEKKVDYFERAKRVEELPLLKQQHELECEQLKEVWQQQEKQRIENLKKERETSLSHRDRLVRMQADKSSFVSKLQASRMSVYKDKLAEWEKKYNEERKKRLAERKRLRKEDRRRAWLKEKEEEEQRKRDEELKRQREEQKRREEEEYQEKMRKLEEIEEQKRVREAEIERKRQEEMERIREEERAARERPPEPETSDWRRGPRRDIDDDRDRDRDRGRDGGPDEGKWRPRPDGDWRTRERARQERWGRSDDDRPERRDDDKWRRGPRDEEPRSGGGGRWRDDDRDDRGPRRDFGRDDERDGPRGRFEDRPRRDFGDRDDRDRRDFGGRDRDFDRGPRRDFGRDDRGPRRDFGRDDRDGRRDFGRDDRDGRRDFGGRDDRGPRRDFGDDRGPRRDFGDDRGPRRDFGDDRGPRRDFGDDRGPRRDFGDDRGPRRGGFDDDRGPRRGGFDDDRGPRRDFGDDRGPRRGGFDDEGGSWRRGGDRGGDRDRDGDRGGDRGGDAWRRGGDRPSPSKDQRAPPPEQTPEAAGEEDDGWTKVRR